MSAKNTTQGSVLFRTALLAALTAAVCQAAVAQVFDNSGLYKITEIGAAYDTGGSWSDTGADDDDEATANVGLGFSFTYYGTAFTNIVLTSNGFATFDLSVGGNPYNGGGTLPGSSYPPSSLALFGTDLDPDWSACQIDVKTTGTAPYRTWVVKYQDVYYYASTNWVNGNIKLYETTNIVEFHYGNCEDNVLISQDKSGGIQNWSRASGHQLWRETGTDGPPNNAAWRFDPNPVPVSLNRITASPVKTGATVQYSMVFDRAVSNVTAGDFQIAAAGLSGSSVTGVSGGGTTWTVSVYVGTGNGTLTLSLNDGDRSIHAQSTGHVFSGLTGQTFTVDGILPTFTPAVAAPDPVVVGGAVTITFSASEALSSDPAVNVNGHAAAFAGRSGNDYTYTYTTVLGSDPVGAAAIAVLGADLAYNLGTGGGGFTIVKATPTVTAWPTASTITYGETLASSSLTGGTASVPGSFAWTTPGLAPNAGTGTQAAQFTPTDTANYNPVSGSVEVVVNKATPTVIWPAVGAITYGQTLSDATLTGGSSSTPGTFGWNAPSTVPNAGSGQGYPMTFTPSDSANYLPRVADVFLVVNKATPTVGAWPTVSAALTYGSPLSALALDGGSASVPGSFDWTDPALIPDPGTADQSVTFTPADPANYEVVSGVTSVTVNKATPAIITPPTASAITEGQALSASTLNGGVASVSGVFAFTAPGTVPPLGTNPQSVTFTPDDQVLYSTVLLDVSVTVNNKQTPTITTPPTASPITYGQALSASALTGGAASVPGVFTWSAPGEVPHAGTADRPVTFTPDDTLLYNPAGCLVSVTVQKATPGIVTPPTASDIREGQALAASALTGGVATVPGVFAWTTPATIPDTGTTSQPVTFTPSDASNYNPVALSVSVTARMSLGVTLTPTSPTARVGQPFTFTAAVTGGTGTIHYEWFKDDLPAPYGTDNGQYSLPDVTLADKGVYRVDVSDSWEAVASNEVTLDVDTGLPVTGAAGLGVLVGAFALAGALAARRRK